MTVTKEERIEILKLANPAPGSNSDVSLWLKRARELEAYVIEGQGSDDPPKKRRGRPPKVKTDTPQGPAFGSVNYQ